jgi:hypothetical protein
VVRIDSLVINTVYSIIRAERVNTSLGDMIMISIRDSPDCVSRIFLPKSYSVIYTNRDLFEINSCTTCYTLIYRGILKIQNFTF